MFIISTSAVAISSQAVSPVSMTGLSAATAGAVGRPTIEAPAIRAAARLAISNIILPRKLLFAVCLTRSITANSGGFQPPIVLSADAWLQRVRAGLASADAQGLLDGRHEDLAVADLASVSGL